MYGTYGIYVILYTNKVRSSNSFRSDHHFKYQKTLHVPTKANTAKWYFHPSVACTAQSTYPSRSLGDSQKPQEAITFRQRDCKRPTDLDYSLALPYTIVLPHPEQLVQCPSLSRLREASA